MRKTPNKWAVMRPKMKPKILTPRLETDDLSSQKSQNALKTRADQQKRRKEEETKEEE